MAKTRANSRPKLSKEEVEARTQIRLRLIDFAQSAWWGLITLGCIFCFSYFAIYLPVEMSAGQETTINYAVKFLADVKLHVWIAWGTAAGCGMWATTERRKRLSERKEKDERIKKLEQAIDPNRTSSGLSVVGDKQLENTK